MICPMEHTSCLVAGWTTKTVWRSKYTARGCEGPHSDEGCFCSYSNNTGHPYVLGGMFSTDVVRNTRLLWQTTHQLSPALKSVIGEQLYVQPPEGWTPKLLQDGRRVMWKVRKAVLGLRKSPRRWQEHLSNKLKERGFIQDERDPCLFVNVEVDIFIKVHVDDMLAAGSSEPAETLLHERSLCRTPRGYNFGVSCEYVTQMCKDFGFWPTQGFQHSPVSRHLLESDTILEGAGQSRHRQLLGRSTRGIVLAGKNAVCQLSTRVAAAATRGDLAYNVIVGAPQGSVLVMTDAKDRRSYSGIAVWVRVPFKTRGILCTLLPRSRTLFA